MIKRLMIVPFLAFLLVACNTATPTPQETSTLTSSPIPSATKTATATLPPATKTLKPTKTTKPTSTPTPEDCGPDDCPSNVNPLTGLVVDDPKLLERRPMGVKIQLFPRGQRPLWGITSADLVFDYYQNNGLTRLHAIFYGEDAEIAGPIRSARLFDGEITEMYKSIFVFGSADRRIINRLFNADYWKRLVVEGSNLCPVMCRIEPESYNYLVTDTSELGPYIEEKGVDNTRQDLSGMTFQFEPPEGGDPAEQLTVRYSISAYTRWKYDDDFGHYLRFQDAHEAITQEYEQFEPFTDREGEQVAAENVVVLFAEHDDIIRWSTTTEIIEIDLFGTGDAYIFRDGKAYQVQWNRPSDDSVIYLTDPESGDNFPYKHGITWYEVLGVTSLQNLTSSSSGEWRVEHRMP